MTLSVEVMLQVSRVATSIGAGVYFNTMVPWQGKVSRHCKSVGNIF